MRIHSQSGLPIYNSDEIKQLIVDAIPYPNQISGMHVEPWQDGTFAAVRFTWRGTTFRVTDTLGVECVEGRLLVGSNIAIVLERLLETMIQQQATR
jgi:hypothetical protein